MALESEVSPATLQDYSRAQPIMYEPKPLMIIEELQETLFSSQLPDSRY